MDPTPNEYSATVLGVLYMVSHGRFPTPESYTSTSALGPSYISKCWRMAASRKRYLINDGELNNQLMSQIYESLAIQASAYDSGSSTKHTVLLGAHQAIMSFLETISSGSSSDIMEFPVAFLTQENEMKRYYSQVNHVLQERTLFYNLGRTDERSPPRTVGVILFPLPRNVLTEPLPSNGSSMSIRCNGNASLASLWLAMDLYSASTIPPFRRSIPDRCLTIIILVTIYV
jgi:hypothetical protein